MASVARSWRTVDARSLLDSDPVAANLEPRSRYRPSRTWVGTVQEIYRVEREAGREPVAREEDRGRRTGTSRAQRDERRPRTLRILQLILRRRLTYHMSPMTGVSAEPCRWFGFVQIARQLAFPLPGTKPLNRFPNCSSSPSPLTLPSLRCNLVTHPNRIQRTIPRSHWIPRSPPSFPRGISELPTGSPHYSRAQSWRALRRVTEGEKLVDQVVEEERARERTGSSERFHSCRASPRARFRTRVRSTYNLRKLLVRHANCNPRTATDLVRCL